jgi:hypothetical protein
VAAVRYWKDPNGIVHLDGEASKGAGVDTTVIFTLPAGYRPASPRLYTTTMGSANLVANLNFLTNGNVQLSLIPASPGGNVFFDGVTFATV